MHNSNMRKISVNIKQNRTWSAWAYVQSEMVSFQLTFSHYLFNTTSIKHKTNTAVFIHMLSHMFIVGKVSEGLTLWDWNQAIDLEKKRGAISPSFVAQMSENESAPPREVPSLMCVAKVKELGMRSGLELMHNSWVQKECGDEWQHVCHCIMSRSGP